MTISREIEILGKGMGELKKMSKEMLLSFSEKELGVIREYYKKLGRNPKDIELETIAQTWSEHCKHKTFSGRITYVDSESGKEEVIDHLLKSTIMKATTEIGKRKPGFLISVFRDNAGIIGFNKYYDIAFKAETHNHPSALEPYGGAATGIGGVIRDILGVGMGAKPIANTDVFCFGPHDYPLERVPESILHPKRIAKGVRGGVRDYGNRMGIPTLNGAIIFDERYLGNPLVYCGTVGIMDKGMHGKEVKKGDRIVAVGDRTGRDGIHGVTFASVELDEQTPSSPVQIGNPIEEKKTLDVLLKARDKKLYNSITDCGGGGFSSAIGEMGEEIGCRVFLDKAPLKYRGLKPWEIWISESQERMVLSVPENKVDELVKLFAEEDVEASVIGEFTGDKKLSLYYREELIGELDMEFLHDGLPKVERKAEWKRNEFAEAGFECPPVLGKELKTLLGMPNIASKESTIRQYDHEVQGGSALKPLVGVENDGPGDAAIVRPLLDRDEGVVISNGINPLYGNIDPYWMAASAIDEALRNFIAVGGNPGKVALLDNFSWGSPEKSGQLAGIVRACKACHDFSLEFDAPFVSGKDSLYNEYSLGGKTISIPGTLLISAFGVIDDAKKRVSSDFKGEGNSVYVVGKTYNELGGSHYLLSKKLIGNSVPEVRAEDAKKNFKGIAEAIEAGLVKACHDCSEGGLGVALAEMAFGGMPGCEIDLGKAPLEAGLERADFILFSESNSRFVVEVEKGKEPKFEKVMGGAAFANIGNTTKNKKLAIGFNGKKIVDEDISLLKKAWKETLKW